MGGERKHQLRVSVQGVDIDGWQHASITSDILTPGDSFTLTHHHDPRVYELLRLDAEVTILVDDTPVMNGFVETRRGNSSRFTVSGKDRVARMVAETAPLDLDFRGKDLVSVARALVAPWFERVVLSNAENRLLMRGQGKKARARGKPLLNHRTDDRRVAPGASKWEAFGELLHRAGYLAWSSGDGRDLIIARPDYDQDAQFSFYVTEDSSNCAGIEYQESNASRYALIVGAGSGGHLGIVRDNPDTASGVGHNFLHPKRLLMPMDGTSVEECQRLVERERAEREAASFEVTISAWHWGMVVPPADAPTLYAPDTVISAFSENTPVDGAYYVTARTFTWSRQEEKTQLRCVPLGVQL